MYGQYATDPNTGKRLALEGYQLDAALAQEEASRVSGVEKRRLASMVRQFNEDPVSFTDAEVKWVTQTAPAMGFDISEGLRKDDAHRAGFGKHLLAGGVGALDALLFDLLKDTWYSDRHTKTAKNAGKIAGTLASLYYGGALAKGVGKGIAGLTAAGAGRGLGSAYTTGLAAAKGVGIAGKAGYIPKAIAFAKPMVRPLFTGGLALRGVGTAIQGIDPMNLPMETLASKAAIPMFGGYGDYSNTMPLYYQIMQQQAAQQLQGQQQ